MHLLRKVLFYFFVLLYLVVTPLVILYALGYQLRPGQEQALVRAGVLSLDTTPGGARIYLGSSRYRWKTPTVLHDLKPGDYPIRVTLRDHQPWSASVRVAEEKATVLDHLLLLPNPLLIRRTSTNRYITLYPTPVGPNFLLGTGPHAGELVLCDTARALVHSLLPADDAFGAARLQRLHQVADNPCLLIEAKQDGRNVFGWRRLDVEKENTTDITSLLPAPPEFLTWDVRERDDLFTLEQGRVSRIDLDDRAVYPDVLQGVRALAPYRGDLLVLDQSNRFFRINRDGKGKPETLGQGPVDATRPGYTVYPLNDEVVLFGGPTGDLLVNREPYQLLDQQLRGLALHPGEEVAAIWDARRVGTYAYRYTNREDKVLSAGIDWQYTSPHPIDQVFWCHDASHLLLAGAGQLDLLALPSAGGPSVRPLIRYAPGTAVFYSERAGAAYYLEPDTRHLMELQLLPRRELLGLSRDWTSTNHWNGVSP